MDFSNYIVPIYAGKKLIGTGVLHNSLLITAAHVVKLCQCGGCFYFKYNNNNYVLDWSKKIFFEYDEIKMGDYRDLAIFRTEVDIKGLSFESEKLYDGEVASIYGYYDDKNNKLLINQDSGKIRLKSFWDEKSKISIEMNKNSFLLMDIPELYECNSGCPLMHNDKVLGLLSQGNSGLKFCRLISSNHIIDVLSKNSF